ncbi:MAG: NAD(P)/FAD-dependent oxidoreductase, partial [Planctomycetota bacterium]
MQEYNNVSVLIIGAGPAGLATAITLKKQKPDLDIVVIDKAAGPGNHNLSGAVLEPKAIAKLMDPIDPNWAESDEAKGVLLSKVNKDDVMFLLGNKLAFFAAEDILWDESEHIATGIKLVDQGLDKEGQ